MNIDERAMQAKRLRADEAFQNVMAEIRDDAIATFLNSGAAQAEAREEAHRMIRALDAIESKLAAAEGDKLLKDRKDQHRGSD